MVLSADELDAVGGPAYFSDAGAATENGKRRARCGRARIVTERKLVAAYVRIGQLEGEAMANTVSKNGAAASAVLAAAAVALVNALRVEGDLGRVADGDGFTACCIDPTDVGAESVKQADDTRQARKA